MENRFSHQDFLDQSDDFGFSFADADTILDTHLQDRDVKVKLLLKRLELLYNLIQPLLKNLTANPGKDYIVWPDRIKKVAEFSRKIDDIYNGKDGVSE